MRPKVLVMAYVIDSSCTNCDACLHECPTGSIAPGREHYIIDADTCAEHRACVEVCPVNAIHLIQKEENSG